ncbi:MAG: hypothetical protein V1716_03585 [Candidatus Uhrbacteria bacterium]
MQTFFKPTSYKIKNGKWVSSYYKNIGNGQIQNERKIILEGEFDTEEEANKNAENYFKKL